MRTMPIFEPLPSSRDVGLDSRYERIGTEIHWFNTTQNWPEELGYKQNFEDVSRFAQKVLSFRRSTVSSVRVAFKGWVRSQLDARWGLRMCQEHGDLNFELNLPISLQILRVYAAQQHLRFFSCHCPVGLSLNAAGIFNSKRFQSIVLSRHGCSTRVIRIVQNSLNCT